MRLIEQVRFAQSYSFKYSKRIGTRASNIDCFTSEQENERLQILQKILNNQKKQFNMSFLDKEVDVFFKGRAKKNNQFRGTTKWMQTAIFECDHEKFGNKVRLKINNAFDNCLMGELV